ncbi:E3 ubiquitin-protein ligase rnf8-A [Ooceraea biroi]|uniref:E3 ubiquitin-protein ligase CHFR n=1 Tax=Ooceraea biroi TaxID=2015173 RepID=A0A026WYX5_OOCBI|nr:E3 ubiquitin-protein ligase rnf8-A [Ooceraea biroi]EZA60956.1 E3 ubiquitin-protein ligase RNF8-A [Ooceraea biroi]
MERGKRASSAEAEPEVLEPVLMRLDNDDCIHIDKNEFKIGRGKDNDEIILDIMISRRHCIFKCEGDEWEIKDLSSSATFVNNVVLLPGVTQKIYPGDIIQLSPNETFKYIFTFAKKEHQVKKPRIDEKILDTVLTKQKTFVESQECQKKELKNKLETKQKEQDELKQQLEELLSQQTIVKNDKEELLRQISVLESKIEAGNAQEQQLQCMYSQLLETLESDRQQFEARINEEKQKWQEALNMSKLEKEMLEAKMKEQMEKWREEQQTEWRNMMENKVKEEKNIQVQLMNEKTMLEEKLKETEKALKEQEAKAETSQAAANANIIGTIESGAETCIFVELVNVDQSSDLHILDTIDLTGLNDDATPKENILDKVTDIMDEQLTCSICSELFVKATTLNCTHSFCHHCITIWNKKRRECPICRKSIISMNKSLVLDNFIESMIENLPTELKNRRKEIIQEREVIEKMKRR